MEVGALTDRVVFEKRTAGTAPNGDLTSIWAVSLTTWADVKVMTGEEQVKAGKLVSGNRIRLTLRYRTDVGISVGDRITWRQRTFLVEEGVIFNKDRTAFTITALAEFKSTVII